MIEIVLVLAITAVLSAIAIPRYTRSLERYRADAAAGRIVADFAYARNAARTKGASQTVDFDVAGNSYSLVNMMHLDHGTQSYIVELALDPYRATMTSVSFDDLGTINDVVTRVIFDGYGVPDSGGMVTITAGEQTRTVVLDPDSGKASIE